MAGSLCAEEQETWTYWVSGGKRGIDPRKITNDQFLVGVSQGFVNDRAVGFTPNWDIEFLRVGKDIEEPEFADPDLKEIGAVAEKKVWKAEYADEARKRVKAIMLVLEDDYGELRPFFFIAANKGERLSVRVQPNAEETDRVNVALTPAKGGTRTFAFTFPDGKPRLMKAKKSQ